jgi:murein tripeptide amidase MpaA
MVEGFLDFILGPTEKARFLRKYVVFKVVPMVNPDGVVLGNYRTGLSGKDFNRQYKEPEEMVFPEVFAFKNFVAEQKAIYKENLSLFIDFHGHSVKKNTFAYGP